MSVHTATYSAEDNKLRLYVGRVPRADYDRLRAAGFTSTPKQDCDFVATWTPQREDLAREFLAEDEDIGDEDYSPQERAADRAERFGDYRDKRRAEAGGHADTFEAGPSAFGHQNRARAERQATRHDRHRGRALSQWSKAEYWQERTAGVIAHALYKSSAAVRRSRILRLEAEQRKHEKGREEYRVRFEAWSKVATMEGADVPPRMKEDERFEFAEMTPALRLAYSLANSSGCWGEYVHPRNGCKRSLYSHLTDAQGDPITPREAAALWLENAHDPNDPDTYSARWSDHYANRLAYERAMLAAEGGTAAEADMEPGGWIHAAQHRRSHRFSSEWVQIQKVNKSPATGRVVSVQIGAGGFMNIERLPEGAYRAPTDEERLRFAKETAERKAKEKATKPAEPALINPTEADAQRLQDAWNAAAIEAHKKAERWGDCPPVEIAIMTQKAYSDRAKGDYGPCETVEVTELLQARGRYRHNRGRGRVAVFKVRVMSAGSSFQAARRVVVLTDKPQKPIPWAAADQARAAQTQEADVFPRLGEILELLSNYQARQNPEAEKLLDDARYVGWVYSESMTQQGFTPAGIAALERFRAMPKPEPVEEAEPEPVEEFEAAPGLLFAR